MEHRLSVRVSDTEYAGFTLAELRQKGVPENAILAAAKQTVTGYAYEQAKGKVNASAGQYAPHEAARWTKLVQECEDFQATGNISSYLAALDLTPEALNMYVGGVLAKAAQFETRLAQITKRRDEHSAAIAALSTPEAVLDYDVTAGWN